MQNPATLAPETLAEVGGWQAIVDNNGIAIAITGMAIVFTALALISTFIAALPRVLEVLGPYLPDLEPHGAPPSDAERTPTEQEQVVAAIGFVLHHEANRASQK